MLKKEIILIKDLEIEISYKKIKNLNLKVSIDGTVKVSAPKYFPKSAIEKFVESKIEWIQENLDKFSESTKFRNKNLESGEKHFVLGEPKILKVIPKKIKNPKIFLEDDYLNMEINPSLSINTKLKHLNNWYENLLIKETIPFFDKWEKELGVNKTKLDIKKMKGKWGYCDIRKRSICLNLELVKRNLDFVEYVVLHELCHLIVPNHGPKFKDLLNKHLPHWKNIKANID
jgi:hypothetical protein